MNNVVHHDAEEIYTLIRYAAMNYDVWRALASRDARPKYVPTMNAYLGFFAAALHAHLVASVVTLYALYETRKDTFNFARLARDLRGCPGVPARVHRKLSNLIGEAKPIWIKAAILRNEAIGHVTESRQMKHTFAKANLSPVELERLIRLAKRTLNYVGAQTRGLGYAFNSQARADTLRVLHALHSSGGGTQ